MKQMLTFCALILSTGFAINASAEVGCPSDLQCERHEWRSVTCNDLRTSIATFEAVSYGSSLYFNRNIAKTSMEQNDFCEARYGSMFVRTSALPTRTQDDRFPFGCPLSDVAFKCGRVRAGH